MFNKAIELVSETYDKDDVGQQIVTGTTYKKVYAEEKPIYQQEFFLAGQQKIKPSTCFVIRYAEYNNETKIRYASGIYSIYRVYKQSDDFIQLYCERRASNG